MAESRSGLRRKTWLWVRDDSREWNRLLTSGGRGRKAVKPLSRKTVRNIAGLVSSAYTRV